jgi:phosphoribosylamine---glycine ligase
MITGLRDQGDADTRIFHAGTLADGDAVVTGDGWVACVCALGETVGEAQRRAYERLSRVHFEGMYYHRDIGARALARARARR